MRKGTMFVRHWIYKWKMEKNMNEGYNLESISRGRNNNLNLIRFIAALMVILGHSYVATTAGKEHEFMCIITQN